MVTWWFPHIGKMKTQTVLLSWCCFTHNLLNWANSLVGKGFIFHGILTMIKHGDDTALDFTDDMIQLNLLFQGQWQNNSSKWEDSKIPLAKKVTLSARFDLLLFFWSSQSVVFAFVVDLAMDLPLFGKAQTTLSSSDLRQSQAIEVWDVCESDTAHLLWPKSLKRLN